MWPFGSKLRHRRLELRRGIAASRPSLWRRFYQAGGVGSLLIALLFYCGAAIMDLWPSNPLPYRPRQFVANDIRARVPFKVLSEVLRKEEEAFITNSLPATFTLNSGFVDEVLSDFATLPDRLQAATQPKDLEELKFSPADAEALDEWRPYSQGTKKAELQAQLQKLREALVNVAIMREADAVTQRMRNTRQFKTVSDGKTVMRDIGELISTNETRRITDLANGLANTFDPPLRRIARERLAALLVSGKPTYLYDNAATQRDQQQARANLRDDPPQSIYKKYATGDVLVTGSRLMGPDKKEVHLLSENDLELLRAEHRAFLHEQRESQPWQWWGRLFGRSLLLLLITTLLCIYIVHFRRDLVSNHLKAFTLAGALLSLLALNKVLTGILQWNPQTAVLACLLAAAVLVVAFGQRFAWTCAMVFAVLVTMQMRLGLTLFLLCLVSITAMVFQLNDIRSRSKLLVVAIITSVITLLTQWAIGLSQDHPWRVMWTDGLWAAGPALLVGFLVQGLLPLIERAFGIATSMTLLEYADASKPVLKRLAMEAPGTYNHSLQLGSLCEAAAESIGARGLLARVGAYYHDIGKINKPDYFVENQPGSASKHAKLSPAMSLLIIVGHVKDGIELAREYGLPRILHEFIASHHGTTLVQYFYQAATEKRKTEADRAPDEVEFRYPGPKPRSKEAAILMLADASESSVRSMGEATPGRIENQVHTMISRRLMDGQLDECELTLREVHRIETSLIKSLCSMYHLRVAYATPSGQKPSAAELLAARKRGEKDGRDDKSSIAPAELP